jgi:hypothetical protein
MVSVRMTTYFIFIRLLKTIDYDLILDSPLYQCKEIDDLDKNGNKIKIAFVSCIYYCS